jgi:SAM-dependent methyltransferase
MTKDSDLTSYDSISIEDYISHVERPDSWNNLYERPQMLSLIGVLEDKNVLDIGSSTGFYTEYALRHGARVTAIDISRKLMDYLTSRIKSTRLKTIRADISRPMPFLKSDSFDCIICSLVLHYIKEWGLLLSELHRVVRPGGRLFISTHHPFSMYLYLKSESYFEFKLIEDTWGSRGPHPFKVHYYIRTLEEILRQIIDSSFNIISIDEPLPDERCRELSPETHKKLSQIPGFMFMVLEKQK